MTLEHVANAPLQKELLFTHNCYILGTDFLCYVISWMRFTDFAADCISEVFVWTGRKTKWHYRNAAIAKAKVHRVVILMQL